MAGEDSPSYYKLHVDTWRTISSALPRAQAAKLLYAMLAYFFDGEEPAEGTLPREARALFDIQATSLDSYRSNAIKGATNRRGRGRNYAKTYPKTYPKT